MNATEHRPRKKRWRVLGCLVRAPLGCLAFLIGGTVVLVLFLPPALGNLISRSLEDFFGDAYAGSLDVNEAWIGSAYTPQAIDSFILRDPDGNEVLHGSATAPSFGPWLMQQYDDWGPIDVKVARVALVDDEDGLSNLERALTAVESDAWGWLDDVRADLQPIPLRVNVGIEQLTWSDAAGHSFRVRNVVSELVLTIHDQGVRLEASGHGAIDDGPAEGIRFTWNVENVCAGKSEASPWAFVLNAEEVPVSLLRCVFGPSQGLEVALGETLRVLHVELSGGPDEVRRVDALSFDADLLAVELQGTWPGGSDTLVAADDDAAVFRLPADSVRGYELLGQLIPFAEDVRPVTPGETTVLRLEEFVLPFDADLTSVSALVDLGTDRLTYRVEENLRKQLGLREREDALETLRLDGGQVLYANGGTPPKPGMLAFDGTYDLRERTYALLLTLPDRTGYDVRGKREALEIELSSNR